LATQIVAAVHQFTALESPHHNNSKMILLISRRTANLESK